MSRTRPRANNTSPVKKYISFSGGTGMFNYYLKDTKETIELESIKLIVLDTKSSISGFDEKTRSRISSNLVTNTKKDVLKVFKFRDGKMDTIEEGLYENIKPKLGKECKFTTNIFALCDVGDGEEIVNLQLSGSGLGSWMDMTKKTPDFYDYAIILKQGALSKRDEGKNVPVTKKEEKELDELLKKKPRSPRPVWFYVVEADLVPLTDDEAERAITADELLQEYFDGAKENHPKEKVTTPEPEVVDDEEEDDLPF